MGFARTFRDLENEMEIAAGLKNRHPILRSAGLAAVGVTVLALGVVVGRELRQRYKFNRRTPYDVYAHAGDLATDVEFGVGI